MNIEIDKIKSGISILEVAKKYVKIKNNKALCIFHNDHNPSMSFDIKRNRFKCFSCGASGSVIDFIMKVENKTFTEAVEYLNNNYMGIKATVNSREKRSNTDRPVTAKDLQIYAYFESIIHLTYKGKEYLRKRGLSDETIDKFKIKSIDKPKAIFFKLKNKYSIKELKQAGFVTSKDSFIFWQPSIIFTYYRNNKPVYYSSRNLNGKVKTFKLACKEKYFIGNIKTDRTFIFEGIFDALSYYELEKKDNFISLNGLITPKKIDFITQHLKQLNVVICFDNDITGAISRLTFEKGIKVFNWDKLLKNDVYEVIKKRFKDYETANKFFNLKGNRNLPEYKSKIKDLNDFLLDYKKKEAQKQAQSDSKELSNIKTLLTRLTPLQREDFNERAGIMEFDGGLNRNEAEKEAFKILYYRDE